MLGRCRMRFLAVSLCVHLMVFWPHQKVAQGPAKSAPLKVRIAAPVGDKPGPGAEPSDPEALPLTEPSVRGGAGLGRRSRQGAKERSRPEAAQASDQALLVPKEAQQMDSESAAGLHRNLVAYKFAVALAALEFRPDPSASGPGSSLRGVALVDIQFIGNSNVPAVSLGETSGSEEVDGIALRMVRRAVENVPAPAILDGESRSVSLSVVLEGEQQR